MKNKVCLFISALAVFAFFSCEITQPLYESPDYTVTYDDGNGNVQSFFPVKKGSLLTAPEVPARTGFNFNGWYIDTNLSTLWDFGNDRVTSDTTLYGSWASAVTYTVTFDSQQGSAVLPVDATAGSLLSIPLNPVRPNYNFVGWFKDRECLIPWNFGADLVEGPIQLTADWKYIEGSPEIFDNKDEPIYYKGTEVTPKVSGFMKPWNYDKPQNSHRSYPIIIGLHGSGAPSGSMPYEAWYPEEKRSCPAFLLAPWTSSSDWATECSRIIAEVEGLMEQYRIDRNRIYITGYSMGGGGSYSLAEAWYAHDGTIPAGITRYSGQTHSTLSLPIAAKTAVWYHSGLDDSPLRVSTGKAALIFFKDTFPDAVETATTGLWTQTDGMVSAVTTFTLTLGTREIFKLTEWTGCDHSETGAAPRRDNKILPWLYSQSLLGREPE